MPSNDDLWTFSVFAPSTSASGSEDDNDGSRQLYQLQRALEDDDPRRATNSKITTKVTTQPAVAAASPSTTGTTVDPTISTNNTQEEIEIVATKSADERTSLLEEEKQQSTNKDSSQQPSQAQPSLLNPTGWTFSSPFWTLQSSILLKMTYKPAWQVLPEYTRNQCNNNDGTNTNTILLGATGSFAAACCCSCACCGKCCDGTQADPYRSITFTTRDVVKVQSLPSLEIRGVGECSGLRLQLQYPTDCFRLTVPTNVPQQYQEGWQTQVQHATSNRQTDDESQLLRKLKQEIEQDRMQAETIPDQDNAAVSGPIITFAMPKDTPHDNDEPPMLWKVDLPPPEHAGPIAIESLTVMDGPLLPESQSNNKEEESYKPTHMFVNGYQSWSFAGSVPIGQKQPQPAMPDTFSKAFNHGATLPPMSLEYIANHSSEGNNNHNHKHAILDPPPENPYLSDFFTCITSHEEELLVDYDDKTQIVLDTKHITPDQDHAHKQRNIKRPRRRKIVQRPLDERGGPALVLGWLSQRRQFGIIAVDKDLKRIQMHASHQGQLLLPNNNDNGNGNSMIHTDWAFCQLEAPQTYDEEPLVHYLTAVAGYNQAKPLQNGPLLTGWCSWYHYYENIDEQSLRANFTTLSSLRKTCPTNVSVVDDGYMTAWGDWDSLKPGKFSSTNSMKAVADNIQEESMRPGIWLAPFTCDKHSKLVQQHPDWIIRNHQGLPANSSNCGKFFYGLDATNPQVLEYVYHCIRRAVVDWGYSVLKIDFLYAACLDGNGKYDLSMSRAEAMHLALHTIRSAAGPNTFLIGCGCPLGPGVGYADGMRISADTGPTWYPALPLPWWDHGTLPSLRGMIRNSITRAPLGHRWWHNDPDCLMLGSTTRLTLEEVASSASIVALTCGMLLLSDDLTKVSPARMRILTKIFPMTGVSAVVLDMHSLKDSHGLPTMLRLWCTDATEKREEFRRAKSQEGSENEANRDHNEEAGYFSRFATFRLSETPVNPTNRQRSCIHMVRGLGTWTILSLSNWLDTSAVVHIPPLALAPPPEASSSTAPRMPINPGHGYHVFAFWSSKYQWIAGTPEHPDAEGSDNAKSDDGDASDAPLLSKLLGPHETEIFHIKPVTPQAPQYLGSDIHFSCGQEVDIFHSQKNLLTIQLRTDYHRVGHIFVFVPIVSTSQVRTTCGGEPCRWTTVGNTPQIGNGGSPNSVLGRVLQIEVAAHADGRDNDGQVTLEY